jgi:flagellar motor component MotA
MKLYPLFVVLALAVLVVGVVFADNTLGAYADLPCLMVTWVPAILLALATHGARGFGQAFATAYRADRATPAEARTALGFFVSLQRYVLVSGLLGVLIGITTMLANLTDASSMGKGLALALLTVMYALATMLLVTMPFRSALERRLAAGERPGAAAQ